MKQIRKNPPTTFLSRSLKIRRYRAEKMNVAIAVAPANCDFVTFFNQKKRNVEESALKRAAPTLMPSVTSPLNMTANKLKKMKANGESA